MKHIRERVVRFGPDNGLAGILTTHRNTVDGLPCVVLVNAGIVHRVGPDRLYVDLARSLAIQGYKVLRFDLAGLGDSEAMTGTHSLEESAVQDILSAVNFLASTRGVTRFVLAGLCSGANYSLLASFREPRVVGALLIDPTVERTKRSYAVHIARRLFNLSTLRDLFTFRHTVYRYGLGGPRSVVVAHAAAGQSGQRAERPAQPAHANAYILTSLNEVLSRGIQLMMVFTGGVNHVYNYERQIYDLLPNVRFGDQLRLMYMPDTDHTVSDAVGRRRLQDAAGAWMQLLVSQLPADEPEAVSGVGA
jgi:alpha/beta superfamily hydrolase